MIITTTEHNRKEYFIIKSGATTCGFYEMAKADTGKREKPAIIAGFSVYQIKK